MAKLLRACIIVLLLASLMIGFAPSAKAGSLYGITERISVPAAGLQTNEDSTSPVISGDGRFVAYDSMADNLFPGDQNGRSDVFVYDRQTGITELVSLASDGTTGNGYSHRPAISADGRYVAFLSDSTNLVPGDMTNVDVFVRDRLAGTTELVTVASDGTRANAGTYLATTISADGRYVGFDSDATNLVPDDTNGCMDLFRHDRWTGVTERVSVSSSGGQADNISAYIVLSADGQQAAFSSLATNLVSPAADGSVQVYVHDFLTGVTELVSASSDGMPANGAYRLTPPALSADGRLVFFLSDAANLVPGDTNEAMDVFVHDRQTGVTERVSVTNAGAQANGASDVFSISGDGRYAAFRSSASNLVGDDTNGAMDIFLRDRLAGATERVSIDSDGIQGNGDSYLASISADGQIISFASHASNLVPSDTNGFGDIFVHDRSGIVRTYPPVIDIFTSPTSPVQAGSPLVVSASFHDPDFNQSYSAVVDWGDGSTGPAEVSGFSITAQHAYQAAGIYSLTLTLTDSMGGSASAAAQPVVVYNPNGGSLSGKGAFVSPAGAYINAPSLTGSASISMTAKYAKGAAVPTGSTLLKFPLANLTFQSSAYDWLVVKNGTAWIQGVGSVNGTAGHGFIASVVDGASISRTTPDVLRIKVWNLQTGEVVYDTQPLDPESAPPVTPLSVGNLSVSK